jgi:Flp pilus assembly protein TadB
MERAVLAALAGVVVSLAVWSILSAAALERARLERALGIGNADDRPARRRPSAGGALQALGALVPVVLTHGLGGTPTFRAWASETDRKEWESIARGLTLLVAIGVFALALAVHPFWLVALFAAPFFARLLVQRQLRAREDRRRRALERDVTGALDVFVLALEAGLPFEHAVTAYIDTSRAALADELRVTVRELEVGYRRREVLERAVARTRSHNLAALASTVRLAEDFGTPLAAALRSLATELRALRRQKLQEAALRAPVTMLLPTAGFILVPIFAIILGPIAIRVLSGTLF